MLLIKETIKKICLDVTNIHENIFCIDEDGPVNIPNYYFYFIISFNLPSEENYLIVETRVKV